ncbi:MAG: protoporphyrinogen oxidase [Burkholderiales bacterium]|nr:protoporphyrinogen oxidase [Burkholderiales bacterium]
MDADVLIVGGGVSGLSVAWWLAQRGVRVEVWERGTAPGGLVGTRRADGYAMETGASLMLNFRPEVTSFLARSGLEPKKQALPRGLPRLVVQHGALTRVPMRLGALAMASFWSTPGRLRLLAEPLVPRGHDEHETASAFVARRLGREALEKLFEPLLASTFGCDPDLAQAHAVLPRLKALEQRYGSIALGVCMRKLRRQAAPAMELFSFGGGMQALVDALASAPGVRMRTQCAAIRLAHEPPGWRVLGRGTQGEHSVRARHLVLSVPAAEAAAVLDSGDAALAALIAGIEYAPLAVAHFGFDRAAIAGRLEGMGFLAPRAERGTLLGCQWTSAVLGGRAPPGKVLLSAYLGGARAAHVADWDEAMLADAALRELRPLLGLRGAPETEHVVHHRCGLPLYHGAHLQRVRRIRDRLRLWPGLHLAANYLDGVSTRDRLVGGYAAAGEICAQMQERGAATRASRPAPRVAAPPAYGLKTTI